MKLQQKLIVSNFLDHFVRACACEPCKLRIFAHIPRGFSLCSTVVCTVCVLSNFIMYTCFQCHGVTLLSLVFYSLRLKHFAVNE